MILRLEMTRPEMCCDLYPACSLCNEMTSFLASVPCPVFGPLGDCVEFTF